MKWRYVILAAGLCVLTSGCGLLIATGLGDKVTDEMEQRFEVAEGGALEMDLDRGSIEVRAEETDSVVVRVTRVAEGRRSQAEAWLARHQISFREDGNDVRVRSTFDRPVRRLFRRSPGLQVSYQVTVPRHYNATLRTSGGRISVAGLTGEIEAATAGGALDFEDIKGGIRAETSGGGIAVSKCDGPVKVETAGGTIRLREVSGNVTAHTSGGSIYLDEVGGNASVETAGGSIDAAGVEGEFRAGTSGGSIRVSLASQPTGDQTLKTSGGGITVQLPATAKFDIDARTSGGRVVSDFAVTPEQKGPGSRHMVKGKVNGGGVLVVAETSGGGIRIESMGQ